MRAAPHLPGPPTSHRPRRPGTGIVTVTGTAAAATMTSNPAPSPRGGRRTVRGSYPGVPWGVLAGSRVAARCDRIDHHGTACVTQGGGALVAAEEPMAEQGDGTPPPDVTPASLHRPDLRRLPRQPSPLHPERAVRRNPPLRHLRLTERAAHRNKHHRPGPRSVVSGAAAADRCFPAAGTSVLGDTLLGPKPDPRCRLHQVAPPAPGRTVHTTGRDVSWNPSPSSSVLTNPLICPWSLMSVASDASAPARAPRSII